MRSTWSHPPSGPASSLPASCSLLLCLAVTLLYPLERIHQAFRFTQRNDLSISWAGFYRMHLHDTPTVLPLRLCARVLHLFPSTHRWAAQTLQSYLRALAHGPCFLRYSDVTRSSSVLSSLHIGSWSHLQCRGVALTSLDSLPAEWSLAQWPITPSKALRVAHRTLATMSSVAQLVLLTHSHSSGRPQQMEGKELRSEDPRSHMWPWLGWWWFSVVPGSLVEDSRDPGVRTHRKAGQGEPRSLQSLGQAPAWEVGVTWADPNHFGAVGGFEEIRKWPPFQGTCFSGAGKSNPWPWSCTCSTTEPPALSEITFLLFLLFPLSPPPFTLPPPYFSLFETWSHTVAQAGLEFTV